MDTTKSNKSTETKLKKIAERSGSNPGAVFKWLMPHFNRDSLLECYNSLDGKKAVGVDGRTKWDYGLRLNENLKDLIERMKKMSYRPQPVREVLIPKEGKRNQYRPLGISVIEDKIVQLMSKRVLESIYEPVFLDCSFGFRPGRGCHDALKDLRQYLFRNEVEAVIDIDLQNFFGLINHDVLMTFLRLKIKDETFMRYVARMLKAGIMSKDGFRVSDEGTPQGSVCSPVLANVVGHYVIDEWFEKTVKRYVFGPVSLFRYCDDGVICCRFQKDAERIKTALSKRLAKFSLKLNIEKTKLVPFSKQKMRLEKARAGTFDFLGFTFVLGKSKNGVIVPKLKTSRKRFVSKLKKVNEWLKENRCRMKMKPLWLKFNIKLEGHLRYYGVSFNTRASLFSYHAIKLFFKWINRRSECRSITWEKFMQFQEKFSPPKVQVYHHLF